MKSLSPLVKRTWSVLLVMLALGVTAPAQKLMPIPPPAAPVPLSSLRDNFRPLLLFTPDTSDPRFLRQLRILVDNDKASADRQIMPLEFAQKRHGTVWAGLMNAYSVRQRTIADPDAVRATYRIAPGEFTVVLVGKDGGEKLRSHQPIPFATLRDTIDSMPMRQEEMRGR